MPTSFVGVLSVMTRALSRMGADGEAGPLALNVECVSFPRTGRCWLIGTGRVLIPALSVLAAWRAAPAAGAHAAHLRLRRIRRISSVGTANSPARTRPESAPTRRSAAVVGAPTGWSGRGRSLCDGDAVHQPGALRRARGLRVQQLVTGVPL